MQRGDLKGEMGERGPRIQAEPDGLLMGGRLLEALLRPLALARWQQITRRRSSWKDRDRETSHTPSAKPCAVHCSEPECLTVLHALSTEQSCL